MVETTTVLLCFLVDAIQQINAFRDFSSSCKKLVATFPLTGTSLGTVVGLLILQFYSSADIPVISEDLAAVFQSFFGASSSYPITTSCLHTRPILLTSLLHAAHSDLPASDV